jgi:hypothetical protein
MVDRRAFLTGSAFAVAVATGSARSGASALTWAEAGIPSVVLIDRGVDGGAVLAAEARAQGLRVLEFSGDVAGVWMRELEPRLRAGRLAIVGHTSAATLFCLDFLARDYGGRTLRRAERGAAVSFVISQRPGRRAALAPAAVHAQWSDSHA